MSKELYIKMPEEAADRHLAQPSRMMFIVTIEEVTMKPAIRSKWGRVGDSEVPFGYFDEPWINAEKSTIYMQELKEINLRGIIAAINSLPFLAIDLAKDKDFPNLVAP